MFDLEHTLFHQNKQLLVKTNNTQTHKYYFVLSLR